MVWHIYTINKNGGSGQEIYHGGFEETKGVEKEVVWHYRQV